MTLMSESVNCDCWISKYIICTFVDADVTSKPLMPKNVSVSTETVPWKQLQLILEAVTHHYSYWMGVGILYWPPNQLKILPMAFRIYVVLHHCRIQILSPKHLWSHCQMKCTMKRTIICAFVFSVWASSPLAKTLWSVHIILTEMSILSTRPLTLLCLRLCLL